MITGYQERPLPLTDIRIRLYGDPAATKNAVTMDHVTQIQACCAMVAAGIEKRSSSDSIGLGGQLSADRP